MLRPGVIFKAVYPPIGGPTLRVGLLDKDIDPGCRKLIDPSPNRFLRRRIGKIMNRYAGRVAHIMDPVENPLASISAPAGRHRMKRSRIPQPTRP